MTGHVIVVRYDQYPTCYFVTVQDCDETLRRGTTISFLLRLYIVQCVLVICLERMYSYLFVYISYLYSTDKVDNTFRFRDQYIV